jgi:tetrahydromethanopterin S-methyltransferase subunit G
MTTVKYEQTVSLGTMITLIGLAISVAVSFALTQSDVQAIKGRLEKVEASMSIVPTQSQSLAAVDALTRDNAARIRIIEPMIAASSARFEALNKSVEEVKSEVRETNSLLRQYLSRDSGGGR